MRRRLDLEIGARDVLATVRVPGQEMKKIYGGFVQTTCDKNQLEKASVVMLSFDAPVSSMEHFMKYFSEVYKVHSILLQCFPLKSQSAERLPGICNCKPHDDGSECKCIVFWNVQDIVKVLDQRMPGSLKRLSDSLCLLPSPDCLKNGCHGCTEDQFNLEEIDEFRRKKGKQAVDDIFEYVSMGAMEREHSCICIPLSRFGYDRWTQLVTRSLRQAETAFSTYHSFTAPRLTEMLLNVLLTGWFRVDGFSSAFVARWAVKDSVAQGGGFALSAFLSGAMFPGYGRCSWITFRGTFSSVKTLSYMIGCVNLICFVSWVVLVSSPGWFDTRSNPPSKPRVVMIMVAIGIALGMDCLHLYVRRSRHLEESESGHELRGKNMVRAVIILEMMSILCGMMLTGILGIKAVWRWFHSAVQVLVGVKWFIGSYLLGDHPSEYDHRPEYDYDNGILVYSSAFLLNCILAGVRCNWNYSLSPSYD